MPRLEAPIPPVPREKIGGGITRVSLREDYVDEVLQTTDVEPLIDPALVLGSFQSYLETGGADDDQERNYSRLEERVVALRDSRETDVDQVLRGIKSAQDVLLARGTLSPLQTKVLASYVTGVQIRVLELWTEPNPTRP